MRNKGIIGDEAGDASGLKMCYAAYSKGTTALLAAVLAAAEAYDVSEELSRQWDMDDPGFSEQVNRRVMRTSAKAWGFKGEMEEIALTFEQAGHAGWFSSGCCRNLQAHGPWETGRTRSSGANTGIHSS